MEAFESRARSGVLCDIVPAQKKILHTVTTPAPRPQKKSQKRGIKMIAAIVVILVIGTTGLIAQADFGALYASTCEGGWANMQKATGNPDLKDQTDPNAFTSENSAAWNGADTSGIVCHGFDGIPDDAHVLSARVGLSWVFKAVVVLQPAVESPGTSETPVSLPASNNEEVLTAPSEEIIPAVEVPESIPQPTSEDVPASDAVPVPVSDVPPTLEAAPVSVPEVVPTPEPAQVAPESALQTLLDRFVSVAHAEDGVPNITATLAFNGINNFVAIEYSADGITWTPVASANLDIPAYSVQELRQLKVRIRTLRISNDLPTIYLDSMWLDVKYRAGDGEESNEDAVSEDQSVLDQVVDVVSDIPEAISDFLAPQVQSVAIETTGAPAVAVIAPQPVVVFGFRAVGDTGLLANIRSAFGRSESDSPLVTIGADTSSLSVKWQCSKRYGTLLLVRTPEDLERDPSKAIVNRANECQGGYITHTLNEGELPRTLDPGTYSLFAADQDELGAWTIRGRAYQVHIDRTIEFR